MATLIDYKNCDTQAIKGTAKAECFVDTGILNGIILVPKNWELNPDSETFDNAYITEKIQERLFHPLLSSVDFAENNEDSVFVTYNTGVQALVRKGLPQLDLKYNNGYCWHSNVSYFDSFDKYNVILVWDNDVFGLAYKSDGITLTGLETGFVHVPTFKNFNGTELSETMIKIQLTKEDQYNKRMALLPAEQNGIDVNDIVGILDAKIEPTTVADTDTTMSVGVTAKCNGAISVSTLVDTNFVVTGKTVSTAVYNVTTKQYDLVISPAFATGEKITVSLTDGVHSSVDVNGVLFSGSSSEQTVA